MSNLLTTAEKMEANKVAVEAQLDYMTATATVATPVETLVASPIVASGTSTSIENILNTQIFGVSVKVIALVAGGAYIVWNYLLDNRTKRKLKFW